MVSLKSAHLYRRVPTDLSKATHTGGAVSLVAVGCIVALLVSNLQSFYRINVERSMEIDQVYDESIVVSFNLTLPRLPCALTSLDLTDAVGTSVHNVTRGLTKMRIDEATDQKLLSHTDTRWMRPNPTPDIRGQELTGHQQLPIVELSPSLSLPELFRKLGRTQLSVVLFGASWCGWTRQFKPTLDYLRAQLQQAGLTERLVDVYSVDCSQGYAGAMAYGPSQAASLYFDDDAASPAHQQRLSEMAQARAALRPPAGAAAKVAAAARAAASKISDAAAAVQMKASPTGPSPTGRQLLQARGAPHDTGAAGKRASHAELLLEEAKAKFARPTNDGADRRDGAQHGGAAGGEQHAMEGVGVRGMWREAAELAARGVPNADNFGPAAQLCSDLHVFSYPTLRIFQDGKPENALNWVGPADHETLFLALLGWLGRQPEGKRAIAAFEASAQEQARPYVERMREARREIQAAASAPKGHHHPNISAAAASISAVRREALAAGVPGFALGLGKNGTGDEGPAKLPLHGNHNSYFEAGADGAEGCEVSGTLKLQRVPGTLRINAHAHYQSLEPGWVNLTHTVNTLLFAKTLNRSHVPHTAASFISSPVINATLLKAVAPLKEGRNMHPLHGQRFAARFRHSDLAHYLKVIPASFAFASGEEGELYLYTANNRFNVRPGETPSLSFGIDISPMRLLYSESHEEWTSFLTSTCAVIGGVFTVFGMVVAMLDTSSEAFAKKSI